MYKLLKSNLNHYIKNSINNKILFKTYNLVLIKHNIFRIKDKLKINNAKNLCTIMNKLGMNHFLIYIMSKALIIMNFFNPL